VSEQGALTSWAAQGRNESGPRKQARGRVERKRASRRHSQTGNGRGNKSGHEIKASEYGRGTHFLESAQRDKSRYVNKASGARGTHSLEGAEAETSQN